MTCPPNWGRGQIAWYSDQVQVERNKAVMKGRLEEPHTENS